MTIINHFLPTVLLLIPTTLAATVVAQFASAPPNSLLLRRTLQQVNEEKPESNDDPDRIAFRFSIRSQNPPTNEQRVADTLSSFGTTLFESSDVYNYRFESFQVEPIAPSSSSSTVAVQVSRGYPNSECVGFNCWRRRLSSEEDGHTSSYGATLTVATGNNLNSNSDLNNETVKQFFLDALMNDSTLDLETLFVGGEGGWTVVEYVATDAIAADGGEPTTTDAVSSGVDSGSSEQGVVVNTNNAPPTNTVDIGGNNNELGTGLGAAAAVCLVAFIIIGFVYRRHNKRRGGIDADSEGEGDFIGDVHAEESESNNKPTITVASWAAGLLPATIMRVGKAKGVATTAATAVEVNEIDKVLADLHSDDSSFVSESSAADTSCYSGMTGISDLNYQPPNNNATDDSGENKKPSLEKVEEMKPSISFVDQTRGSQISLGTAQSMRREESFESDYRDKSAMAKMSLKKDILNVEVAEDEKLRTISPQVSSEMMQQQREMDKVKTANSKARKTRTKCISPVRKDGRGLSPSRVLGGIRSLSPSRAVEVDPDQSLDHLLPSPSKKSDDDLEIV